MSRLVMRGAVTVIPVSTVIWQVSASTVTSAVLRACPDGPSVPGSQVTATSMSNPAVGLLMLLSFRRSIIEPDRITVKGASRHT
jgi:hypothetical protein